jgi:hypothetical protein
MTTRFNELPANVREEIKNTLKAYDEVFVVYEYGKYHVGVGVSLKAKYAPDHKVIGTFYADDIFTKDERAINYIESFHEYPHNYKGKRDYRMLHEIEGDWSVKFVFNANGDLVRA